jgi:hypothetical protein
LVHGLSLSRADTHRQLKIWAQEGDLGRLLNSLASGGFQIYLTSDHGNIEANGRGSLQNEKKLAELRGERVRIYSYKDLRSQTAHNYTGAIEWNSLSLPDDFLPLFAPSKGAFIKPGERVVAHGGISVEELIVPYIRIVQKKKD